ncbi:YkgJ family cysteine cluster protein [Aridibaculum aurantiacum]|uniref:YkgJ family cysteine cluster protein n=1 Tax=Aridibaculum aurantiacum TaxID=2810307 RepID=UPI001A967917|nr:YkgJ family cysteine cluster protein [Aridibaculum aurantiacum]
MLPVNLRSFRTKVRHHKQAMINFLQKLEQQPPKNLDKLAEEIAPAVWKATDCLTCANCCKRMSPTFTAKDIKRIAAYVGMTPKEFKAKWLWVPPDDKDWLNRNQPCQFLDVRTNLCSIYEVRPADCAGFPHLTKKKMVEYIHVHQQNITYCPATYMMVEKLMVRVAL